MKRLLLKNDYVAILVLGCLQGLLSTLSFAPFNYPLLAWFCPFPLFYFGLRFRNSVFKLFLSGAASSLFLCSFSFYWMLDMFQVFGGLHPLLAVLIFVPYTVLLNLKIPLFVLLLGLSYRPRFRHRIPVRILLVGLLALFTDYATPQIFPWYWGNLVAGNPYLVQIAEITGVYGLSFVHFLGSFLLYRLTGIALTNRRFVRSSFAWKRLWPVPALLALCLLFGAYRKHDWEGRQRGMEKVRVAIVQPNSPLERYGEKRVTDALLSDLMREKLPKLAEKAAREASNSDLP